MFSRRFNLPAFLFLALTLSLPLVTGCGGGGGGGSAPPSPVSIQNPDVLVPDIVKEGKGGTVTVSADVSSSSAIDYVRATVASSSYSETKDLANISGTRYSTTLTVPASVPGGPAITYTVTITARDADGNTNSVSSSFQAAALEGPPGP